MGTAVIVGAGLSGATAAALLTSAGWKVIVFETRGHIAGNCHDAWFGDCFVHSFGAHIFHTSNPAVIDFVQRYARWRRVTTSAIAEIEVAGGLLEIPFPFNRASLAIVQNHFPGLSDPSARDQFIRERVFYPYCVKQWGVPLESVPASILNRVDFFRDSDDPNYFHDSFEAVPVDGYTALIAAMLEGSRVELACEEDAWRTERASLVIYSGSLDAFYRHAIGRLEYRSLRFERRVSSLDRSNRKFVSFCHPRTAATRVMDYAMLTEQPGAKSTVLAEETPVSEGVPMYPLAGFRDNGARYRRYHSTFQSKEDWNGKHVIAVGRLGKYAYMDMHIAIAQTHAALRQATALGTKA
jgi:UDP-galactopyranose mutase